MYMNKNITMINEFPMLFLHLVHGEFCEPPRATNGVYHENAMLFYGGPAG